MMFLDVVFSGHSPSLPRHSPTLVVNELESVLILLIKFGKTSNYYFFKIFYLNLLVFFWGPNYMYNWPLNSVSHMSGALFFSLFQPFSLCASVQMLSVVTSSSSLMFSFAVSTLPVPSQPFSLSSCLWSLPLLYHLHEMLFPYHLVSSSLLTDLKSIFLSWKKLFLDLQTKSNITVL